MILAAVFLVIALAAGFLALYGAAFISVELLKLVFYLFLILFVVSLFMRWRRRPV